MDEIVAVVNENVVIANENENVAIDPFKLSKLSKGRETKMKVGMKVFILTVTFYYTGIVEEILDNEIVLTQAAWIPISGRWTNAVAVGVSEIREVEPFPADLPVMVQRDPIVAWFPWNHALPRVQK